jgi:hypothetical protein
MCEKCWSDANPCTPRQQAGQWWEGDKEEVDE